ncbi:restriction endonuclease subunit S [Marinimicrobium sp. ABcell2]|uniref:restriction endonuclease subunit S n=1 Tax=Marinimicrobium sp. ABcell2 TaxID=3069751 RepID=UPI0027B36D3C|nr:restriction endonuclease subunit S [Marinimicrobium sp. ABcell2]MDQ2077788.1 restriction endonuclease subunit S [Marinimicrobium sp. ABcell2]
MGGEWTLRPLKDCATWYSGGTPRKSRPEFWGGDIPWISAKSLHDFYINDSEDKVTELALGNGTRLAPTGAIMFVVRGMSLKSEFRLGITTRPVSFNQDVKALVAKPDIDPSFLVYALKAKSSEILALVEEAGHGTGVLPTSVVQALEIPVPSLSEQKRVTELFSALNTKIFLNRQTNQTLESMAKALFKSWFVDFDPVIDNALAAGNKIPEPLAAKAAARCALREQGASNSKLPHTLPDNIRQLFPSRFQFTEELGWIPEGWSVEPFGSVAPHVRENVAASEIGSKETYVGLEHIGRKRLFLERSGIGSDVESNKSKFKSGDLLFGKLRPYFHKVVLAGSSGICSTDILVFRAKDSAYRSFMALTAYREDFIAHANSCSTGTRMPRASAKDMLAYEIAKPPRNVAEQFEAAVSPMWKKGYSGVAECKKLAGTRDALLPKILSGELRIPTAEKELLDAMA